MQLVRGKGSFRNFSFHVNMLVLPPTTKRTLKNLMSQNHQSLTILPSTPNVLFVHLQKD